MSQRNTAPRDRATIKRTLHWFWWVTKKRPFATFMAVFTSVTYTALLTYANTWVMGLIVDRAQAAPVSVDQVFAVFWPYIVALLIVNAVGQTCSKLQDWSVMQLEMNGNYHLARLCFDTLANQSMTFHTSRFGGSLVSQTSRFMSGYVGLVDVVVYSLIPTIASIVCTIVLLWPASPCSWLSCLPCSCCTLPLPTPCTSASCRFRPTRRLRRAGSRACFRMP